VPRRQPARRKRGAQPHRLTIVVALAEQVPLEAIELGKFFGFAQVCVIGDVVGHADELVERQDDAAMARVDQPRRNGEILVAVTLARTQLSGRTHCDAFA
jgi:hypothetical protein